MVKNIFKLALILFLLLFLLHLNRAPETGKIQYVDFALVRVGVEVADNPLARTQGLSGRESLQEGEGLLFVFDRPGRHSFWMKDMNFPIDIIWLEGDGDVVHIEKDVRPDSYPQTFTPRLPARYVLEVNAGFTENQNIKVGDKAEFGY